MVRETALDLLLGNATPSAQSPDTKLFTVYLTIVTPGSLIYVCYTVYLCCSLS